MKKRILRLISPWLRNWAFYQIVERLDNGEVVYADELSKFIK